MDKINSIIMSKFKARLREKMKDSNIMPKLDLPVVIGRLECLMRYDCFIDNEDNIQEEYNSLSGEYVKWDDLEELIEKLKKGNAL